MAPKWSAEQQAVINQIVQDTKDGKPVVHRNPQEKRVYLRRLITYDLVEAVVNSPFEEASAALNQLRIQAERIVKEAQTAEGGGAKEWLLSDGLFELGDALRRPDLSTETSPEVGRRVAALCGALVAAARASITDPGELQDIFVSLQFAAPTCLRLLSLWLDDPALAVGREAECLALATSTAQLAEEVARNGGTPGLGPPLLRFVGGCMQRLAPGQRAAHHAGVTAATDSSNGSSSDSAPKSMAGDGAGRAPPASDAAPQTAAAAAPAGTAGSPGAKTWEKQRGWAVVLGHAAIATATMAADDPSSGKRTGWGGEPGDGNGIDSGNGSSNQDSAFACSMAAAEELLHYLAHLSTEQLEGDSAISQAIAAPLQCGRAYWDHQQQLHLQLIGSVLEAAVSDLVVASSTAEGTGVAAGGSRSGGAAGCSTAGGGGGGTAAAAAGSGGSATTPDLMVLATRVHLLAEALPHVAQKLFDVPGEELVAWPVWQPWSGTVATCLDQLARVVTAVAHSTSTTRRQMIYGAATQLLFTAELVLSLAKRGGVAALERPPQPAMLLAVAAACSIDPYDLGLSRPEHWELREHSADSATGAVEAMAAALEAAALGGAPLEVDRLLLRDACYAIVPLLRLSAEKPNNTVWSNPRLRQAEMAQPAEWKAGVLLQRLARLITRLLRFGQPTSGHALVTMGAASALVLALAPPPGAAREQRQQRRLVAGTAATVADACAALAALCGSSAEARQAVSAAAGGSSWPTVAAALGQALRHEDTEARRSVKAALQQVDEVLERRQEAAGGAANTQEAANASPARRKGPQKQKAKELLPDRTVDGAEAAMRALLLEEEEAAAAAASKAASRQPKAKQAAAASATQGSAASAAAADGDAETASHGAPAAAATQSDAAAAAAAERPGPAAEASPVREWMQCPITQEVMQDPVLCEADGQTYERAAITAWLQQHGTSPVTLAPAQTQNLIPNHTLRNIIQAALQ